MFEWACFRNALEKYISLSWWINKRKTFEHTHTVLKSIKTKESVEPTIKTSMWYVPQYFLIRYSENSCMAL